MNTKAYAFIRHNRFILFQVTLLFSASVFSIAATDYFWINQYQSTVFYLIVFFISSLGILRISTSNLSLKLTLLDLIFVFFMVYDWLNEIFRDKGIDLFSTNYAGPAYLALYFVCKYLTQAKRNIIIISYAMLGIAILNCLISVLQIVGLYPIIYEPYYITGIFNNPAKLAGYLLIVSPFLTMLFKEGYMSKLLFYVLLIVFFTLILITQSRAAFLGMLLFAVYEIKTYLKINILKSPALLVIITIALSCTMIGLYRFKPASSDGRLLLWKIGLTMVKESPIHGIGSGRLPKKLPLYQSKYFNSGLGSQSEKIVARNSKYIFNEPLRILIEDGAIGFLCLVLLCIVLIRVVRNKGNVAHYICTSLICYFVFSLFSYPSDIIPMNLILYICLGYCSSISKPLAIKAFITSGQSKILLFFLLILSTISISKLEKIYNWKVAEKKTSIDNRELAVTYNALLPYLDQNPYYLHNYFSSLANARFFKEAVELFQHYERNFIPSSDIYMQLAYCYMRLNNLVKAEEYFKLAEAITPILLTPKYYLLTFYIQTNKVDQATKIAKAIIRAPVIINNQKAIHIKTFATEYLSTSSGQGK